MFSRSGKFAMMPSVLRSSDNSLTMPTASRAIRRGLSRRQACTVTGVGTFTPNKHHPRRLGSTRTEQTGGATTWPSLNARSNVARRAPRAEMLEKLVWRLGLVDRPVFPVGSHIHSSLPSSMWNKGRAAEVAPFHADRPLGSFRMHGCPSLMAYPYRGSA